jgi:hypothetical protein
VYSLLKVPATPSTIPMLHSSRPMLTRIVDGPGMQSTVASSVSRIAPASDVAVARSSSHKSRQKCAAVLPTFTDEGQNEAAHENQNKDVIRRAAVVEVEGQCHKTDELQKSLVRVAKKKARSLHVVSDAERCTIHGVIPALHSRDNCWALHPENTPALTGGERHSVIICVRDLDSTITREMIEHEFRRYGSIIVCHDRHGDSAGVRFTNAQDAAYALGQKMGAFFPNGKRMHLKRGVSHDPSLDKTGYNSPRPDVNVVLQRRATLKAPIAPSCFPTNQPWRPKGSTLYCLAHPGVPSVEIQHSAGYCPLLGLPKYWKMLPRAVRSARERYWNGIQLIMPAYFKTLAIDEAIYRMECKEYSEARRLWFFDQWNIYGYEKPDLIPECISLVDFEYFWRTKAKLRARSVTGDAPPEDTNIDPAPQSAHTQLTQRVSF